MRFVRRPLVASLAILLVALLALIAVNAVDQDLDPQVRAFYTRTPVPFAQDSGWAVFMGFHAPAGELPRAFAASMHRAATQRKPGVAIRTGKRPLEVNAPDELLCVPQAMDCVRAFAVRPESIANLAADNAALLGRYEELIASRQLADVVEALDYYEAILPHFSTVLRTQQVQLSIVGAEAASGRATQAVARLEADAAFQRLWLEEAGSILTKMLAVRTLSRDFLVAGQVARGAAGLSPAQWDALERIAAPLSAPQRGVGPVLRVEAALFMGVLDQLIADAATTIRVIELPRMAGNLVAKTVRRNATLNFAYPVLHAWTTLDGVSNAELAQAIARIEAQERRHFQPDWTWLYNPTGKGFARESKPQLAEYVYRVRDLDALASVVRCAIELRRKEVGREAAAAHVAASAACVDPYEGTPLGWDVARGELSFRARSPKQVDRFGGRGDRVAFAVYAP
jgi:hypothetical protein